MCNIMVIWPWPWIFKVKFWKCCISWMERLIDMERKRCESIGCYTHFVTFNFPPHPWPWPWIFKVKFWKSRVSAMGWPGIIGMWVDRILDPCCDFQYPHQAWPWPWILKVKFWKCCISGMGGPIDMERKGCELIGCYTHFVTFNFDFNHDPDLGFSRSNF